MQQLVPLKGDAMSLSTILARQAGISDGTANPLSLPKFNNYAVCNLRGGIGKTSLCFNLSYLTDDILVVDTCPQGNLSFFYDQNYFNSRRPSVYDMILPHIMPGLGTSSRVAQKIGATNEHFVAKNSFFIPSSDELYVLPTQMSTALTQAQSIADSSRRMVMMDNLFYSLRNEIQREMSETNTARCLIDTSPFFSGGTHLVWHATDALIVPVRTDLQSINSLSLLLKLLSSSSGEFRRFMPSDQHTPKIQMIVLTHCGWSTRPGAKNEPNQQTKLYIQQIYDIVYQNISSFTTDDPTNHVVLLDDFLGSGRISSAQSKPIELLKPGETMTINRTKVEVNKSVEKVKRQLVFINNSIW